MPDKMPAMTTQRDSEMNKIEVGVIHESHSNPAGVIKFLAGLTQRGHSITSLDALREMYNASLQSSTITPGLVKLPHGTIKRFTPITIAVVGASRRFLVQARTHQVGLTFLSASLQYSDYSDDADFFVPYEIMGTSAEEEYLVKIHENLAFYRKLILQDHSHDSAAYIMPQALRNVLLIQGNHESWSYFIRTRACRRNTDETRYVTMRIWEALLSSAGGADLFAFTGPDCVDGRCREGKLSCAKPMKPDHPSEIIRMEWPKL